VVFSTTCRAAHVAATPSLLSRIRLSRRRTQTASFCEYILRHTEKIALLRCLEIFDEWGTVGPCIPLGRALASILMQAHNLVRLCLSPSEVILGEEPDIATAIIQCPRLTILRLSGEGVLSRKVVRETRALHKLSFHSHDGSDIAPLIQLSQPTLEALSINSGLAMGPVLNLERGECWPHLRELDFCGKHRIATRTLTAAFPNLRILAFRFSAHEVTSDMRVLNEQHSSSWPSLDYVFGTVNEVHDLALSSQVHELFLMDILINADTTRLERFLDNVHRTTPLVLTFTAVPSIFTESFCLRFAQSARRLQYLKLYLELDDTFVTFNQQVCPLLAFVQFC
jgi:hypothetical protein